MRPREDASNRLLVEGRDDVVVVRALLMRHDVNWDSGDPMLPFVSESEGLDRLLESIRTSTKTYDRLGIVVDVDVDATERWRRVRAALSAIGITLPESPDPDGTVVDGVLPHTRVGAWLMPDNRSPGRLEDFLKGLVPEDDPCWPYAGEATERAKKLGAPFPDPDELKARIHTWLAWQKRPGCPFGTAMTAEYFRHDSQEAMRFVAWFKRLFLD